MVVVAGFGGFRKEPSRHVHVDVVHREFFNGGRPGVSVPIGQIRETLDRLDGEPIEVRVRCCFELTKDEAWPPIVGATRFVVKSGNLALETERVVLKVTGAPVSEIWWQVGSAGILRFWLQAQLRTEVSSHYLVDLFEMISSAYDVFAREEINGTT